MAVSRAYSGGTTKTVVDVKKFAAIDRLVKGLKNPRTTRRDGASEVIEHDLMDVYCSLPEDSQEEFFTLLDLMGRHSADRPEILFSLATLIASILATS